MIDRPLRRCLPIEEWPELDRAAWAAAHRRGGLLDDDGLASSWASATSSIIAGGYGRFLSFLAQIEEFDPLATPAERITRPRVEAYVAHLRERNHSSTVAARILQLCEAARIMAPGWNWSWLRRIRSRLRRMSSPAHDDRARLVPAGTVVEFYADLVQGAEQRDGLSDWKRALLFRDGCILAIFAACGIRPKNMAAMRIGTTLQRRGGEWWLAFGATEMKNKRPYEVPLPGLTPLIDRYIEHHRPSLVARSKSPTAGTAPWLSNSGKPLNAKQIGQIVSRRAKRDLRRAISPRLLRKLIPTELAIHDPEHVGVAQPLLGHADYRVTERAYNLGRAIDAARRYHGLVRGLRDGIAIARQSSPGARAPSRDRRDATLVLRSEPANPRTRGKP